MIGPADPDATLVLRGDGNGGRTHYRIQLIFGSVFLVMVVSEAMVMVGLGTDAYPLLLSATPQILFPILFFSQAVAHAQRVRELRGTELWMSPHGVAYACPAGTFGVPWPAVRWIGFRRGGNVLCVEAVGWKGPVSKLGSYWKGTRTLEVDVDTDPPTVAARIHAATGIQVAPQPV